MKYIKLSTLILGLIIFGCNPTERKIPTTSKEKSVEEPSDKGSMQDKLAEDKVASIRKVIDLFKLNDIEKISNIIRFPLCRQYPIPSIKDKKEFTKRFNEVFDKILIEKIANSKIEQWTEIGWRGIMLDDGVLWMANSDGIITAVNYQSDLEKKLWGDLIAEEKENLFISLKNFEKPIFKIKTRNSLIRIDQLINNYYRYASWKIGEVQSSKPDIIIDNGELKYEGSGGNHVITFVKGNYTYRIYRNILADENSPDITLEVEKNGEVILTEDGSIYE
jgi:hypothetical protein